MASIGSVREARSAGTTPNSSATADRDRGGERQHPPVEARVEEHDVRLRRQLPDQQIACPSRDPEGGEAPAADSNRLSISAGERGASETRRAPGAR